VTEEGREPVFEEEPEDEPSPQPETSSAGGIIPPGRIGSGLWDDSGDREKWRSAPIEELGLSMRAYDCFRRSGLTRVDFILLWSEEQILDLLEHPSSGESFIRPLLTLESPASRPPDVDLSRPTPTSRARKAYEEMRERLDELGIVPIDAEWDTARGIN
jgi:Bacterial RNA polymerase, alpha chain C terminal domain